jgi:hypothetical protein
LYDSAQSVARNYKAERTPQAFVIWKENNNWVVKYNGGIDDNGADPKLVTENYVANAVDELLNRTPIEIQPLLKLNDSKNFYEYTVNDFEVIGNKPITKLQSNLEIAI